ncbi:MAG: sulfotransferase [Rhodothermales bacterium]
MPSANPDRLCRSPYVFVVGCPRSGTTLLQRMLDSHPQLAVANDTHFIPRAIKHRAGDVNPLLTDDLVERVYAYRRFYRLGLTEAEVREAAAPASTYRTFVSNLYALFARKQGKPLAGEKTPDYGRHLPLLHALFPWARFIHIIRDGRDVALSTLEWAHEHKGPGRWAWWQVDPLATCALWWRWQVSTGRQNGAALGSDRYFEVRYEDLVARPEAVLRAVTAFLHLPYSPNMPAFFEGKTRRRPGLSAKAAWLPATPGLRDWRAQMPKRDRTVFEALAGDLLAALDYEISGPPIPPDVEILAQKSRRWWADQNGKPSRAANPSGVEASPAPHAS